MGDLEAVTALFDLYRQFYKQKSDPAGARAFIAARLTGGDSIILVAETDGQIAGFVQLYPLFTSVGMRRKWLLNDLYVLDDHRRRGIAEQLIEGAHAHARTTGASSVSLETQTANKTAQALYEKLGYKQDNPEYLFYTLTLSS